MPDAADKKTILIVEDDEDFRKIIVKSLNKAGYGTCEAEDVSKAKQLIPNIKPDLILSDVRMPGESGIDLLRWTQESGEFKFILMTGFGDVKTTQDALDLGADGFLPKPFKQKDMLDYIQQLLSSESEAVSERETQKYIPISIHALLGDCEVQFKIYLKLVNRFVCIAHKGEDLSEERLQRYLEKKIEELYLTREDYKEWLGYSLSLVESIQDSQDVDPEKKKSYLLAAGESIFKSAKYEGVRAEFGEYASTHMLTTLNVLLDDADIFKVLNELAELENPLYTHSMQVGVMAMMIARELRWVNPRNLFLLSASAMLHDIAKSDWPDEFVLGQLEPLSTVDRGRALQHPVAGAVMVRGFGGLPDGVSTAIEQHHESEDGSGFPKGLTSKNIYPVAKMIHLADAYINFKNEGVSKKKGPKYAFQELVKRTNKYDVTMMRALFQIFHMSLSDFGFYSSS